MQELTGIYCGDRWRAKDSDFVIATFDCRPDESATTTVLGDAEPSRLITGVKYRLSGKWDENAKYGRQFKFQNFVQLEPHTRRGVVKYLERYAPGIGPAIAQRLWDLFGTDAVKQLRTKPHETAFMAEIPERTAVKAADALQKLAALEATRIELTNLLTGRGFHGSCIDACIKKWGVEAPAVVKKDPYVLLINKMPGAGFLRCDAMYLELGHDRNKLKRQMLCIWHYCASDTTGSTWLPKDAVIAHLLEKVSDTKFQPDRAIELGVRSGWIWIDTSESGRKAWLAEAGNAVAERRVAEAVQTMIRRDSTCWFSEGKRKSLSALAMTS